VDATPQNKLVICIFVAGSAFSRTKEVRRPKFDCEIGMGSKNYWTRAVQLKASPVLLTLPEPVTEPSLPMVAV